MTDFSERTKMCDLPDHRDDSLAYEIIERARPDEMNMIYRVTELAEEQLENRHNAHILDLCCGTGLPLIGLAGHRNIRRLVGVDIYDEYLRFARTRFSEHKNIEFVQGDVVTVELPLQSWDIIIMASAYHHIRGDRKLRFLRRVQQFLTSNGRAVIGENILPPYDRDDADSYRDAVRFFYGEVLATAEEKTSLPAKMRSVIQGVAQSGFDGDDEHKTDIVTFHRFLEDAGLTLKHVEKVWPHRGPLCQTTGGNYVFVVARAAA